MSETYTPPPPPPPEPPATTGGGEKLIPPPQPPKDPILILVLNLIVAGCLGYFMMGQKMKGIIALIVWVVGLPFTCGTLSGLVAIVAAIDGYLQSQQQKAGYNLGEWTFFNDHR